MSSEVEFERFVGPETGRILTRSRRLSWPFAGAGTGTAGARRVVASVAVALLVGIAVAADTEVADHEMAPEMDHAMDHGMDPAMDHGMDGHTGASIQGEDMTVVTGPKGKHAANQPIGVARGIHPGRVTWVRDPSAVDWDGVSEGTTEGYWNGHTDQAAVDRMMSRSLQELTGEASDAAAWDALFRHFNRVRGNGDVGYKAGEKINIKINFTTTASDLGRRIGADGTQLTHKEYVAPSLEMTHSLLDQLVNVVGAAQADISMGDTSGTMPNYQYHYLTAAAGDGGGGGKFNDVVYTGRFAIPGRVTDTPSDIELHWGDPAAREFLQDYVPRSYADAKYFINLAILKTHARAGITICAKNFYGSLIRKPRDEGYYNLHTGLLNITPGEGHYRPLVDLMGHEHLGGKTLVAMVDALWTGYDWAGFSAPLKWQSEPFNDSYAASILMSQDIVAIDSVGYDLWYAEAEATTLPGPDPRVIGADDYLQEAALADAPPSGTRYDPEGDGTVLPSLGVHEHWNNDLERQYSRNLKTGEGIELIEVTVGE